MKKSLLALAVALSASWYIVAAPAGTRSLADFDPSRLADLEVQMWQAYYDRDTVRLFRLLVVSLREQYHYSWFNAASAGFDLAQAASTFAELDAGYESVLPDLESAYTTARDWLGAGFDPAEVARAELAWWVARRTPGQDSPERVGGLIADEYALLFEAQRFRVLRAGQLRAEAASLRDRQPDSPDWDRIGGLLAESFEQLHDALNP
jgi:hypothetical protein